MEVTRASEPSVADVEREVEHPQYEKAKILQCERESPNVGTQDRTGQGRPTQANKGPNVEPAKAPPRSQNLKRTTVYQVYGKPKRALAGKVAEKVVLPIKWSRASQAYETLPSQYKSFK